MKYNYLFAHFSKILFGVVMLLPGWQVVNAEQKPSGSNDNIIVMHRSGICTTNYNGTNVYPEESIWSLMAAQRCGVKYVEFDLQRTSDGQFVCLHDATINRTMMHKDGSAISNPVSPSSLTLQQLKDNYVYKSSVPQYRTPIITLEEFCSTCRKLELIPYYHGDSGGNYDYVMQVMSDYCGDFALFLSGTARFDSLVAARKKYPNALIIYDSATKISSADMIAALKQIGGKCGCSTMHSDYTTKAYCDAIRKEGFYVQASIHDGNLLQSLQNGCNMILDNWSIPYQPGTPIKVLDTADSMEGFTINGNSISIQPDAVFLGGFELCIYFEGTLSIQTTGTANQIVSSSDLSTPVVLRKATIKDSAPIVITATAATKINSVTYKQYIF